MGGLKPIGSEKLQGMDKIKRIIEISKYNEHLPNPVNETESKEFGRTLADGNRYEIVKERQGYIIKNQISEGVAEYIEPMKNRKYYSSYSQALKRLNLMAKELNALHENKEGVSLFGEEKKYFLKKGVSEKFDSGMYHEEELDEQQPAPTSPAPAAPVASPSPAPEEPVAEPEMDLEEPMDEPEMDLEEPKDEEEVTFKSIQKLTGKLAQKIRDFESKAGEDDESMSGNDVKYVINSILSALDLSTLDEDDIEEIISRFEGEEEGMEEPDMEGEEIEEPAPEGEMAEMMSLGDALEAKIPSIMAGQYKQSLNRELQEFEDEDFLRDADKYGRELEMSLKDKDYGTMRSRFFDDEDQESEWETEDMFDDEEEFEDEMGEMYKPRGSRKSRHFTHGTFGESKVDKIISKYFTITEEEKVQKEKQKFETKKVEDEIKNLSESVNQERAAMKLLKENNNVKFVGLTNKRNLIFKNNDKQYRVTPDGKVL